MDIQTAIDICGSQAELARRVGVSLGAVNHWVHRVRPIPSNRCISIEEATDGRVTRYDLRPDVFGKNPAASNDEDSDDIPGTDAVAVGAQSNESQITD